eukprot:7832-Heterococcus_DN1.PRE.1
MRSLSAAVLRNSFCCDVRDTAHMTASPMQGHKGVQAARTTYNILDSIGCSLFQALLQRVVAAAQGPLVRACSSKRLSYQQLLIYNDCKSATVAHSIYQLTLRTATEAPAYCASAIMAHSMILQAHRTTSTAAALSGCTAAALSGCSSAKRCCTTKLATLLYLAAVRLCLAVFVSGKLLYDESHSSNWYTSLHAKHTATKAQLLTLSLEAHTTSNTYSRLGACALQ